jgi:tetratricopeptide (TPR) repeat protein
LVYHRIRKFEDLNDRLDIAWLQEEEWGIASFLDFLLRILRSLSKEKNDPELSERIESLFDLDAKRAEHASAKLLLEAVEGRTLAILVENIEDIFEGMKEEGQSKFRAYLQENPFITILGSNPSLFQGISSRDSVFYGFFEIHHLEKLGFEQVCELLKKIALFKGDQELADFIDTRRGKFRIRAVHHLAAGNPRVYAIFAELLTREGLDELVEAVMRTLDDLTPYYQSRMNLLSHQQRKIVETLCDATGAIIVKEIAKRCFITHQTASGQLRELRDLGYVDSHQYGRESYYELREPLMRLTLQVKKHRSEPVRLLVDFIRIWYSPDEIIERLKSIQEKRSKTEAYYSEALKLVDEQPVPPALVTCVKEIHSLVGEKKYEGALELCDEALEEVDNLAVRINRMCVLFLLKRFYDALRESELILEMYPGSCDTLIWKGMAHDAVAEDQEAFTAFEQAMNLNPRNSFLYFVLGKAFARRDNLSLALSAVDKCIDLSPGNIEAWYGKGDILYRMGELDSSLEALKKVVKLNPKHLNAWHLIGHVNFELNREAEAIQAFEQCLTIDPDYGPAVRDLGYHLITDKQLRESDERFKLGEALIRKATSLLPEDETVYSAHYILGKRNGDPEEAVAYLGKAIDLNPTEPVYLIGRADALGQLLRFNECLSDLEMVCRIKSISDENSFLLLTVFARVVAKWLSHGLDTASLRSWFDRISKGLGNSKVSGVSLRNLKAVVDYVSEKDERALLALPTEERRIIEMALGFEPSGNEEEIASE